MTESQNNQWIAIINPLLFEKSRRKRKLTARDERYDYFLTHRNTLGNQNFLHRNVILPIVIISAIIFTITQLFTSFAHQKQGIYEQKCILYLLYLVHSVYFV